MIRIKAGDLLIAVRDVKSINGEIIIENGKKYTVATVDYEKQHFTLTVDINTDGFIPFGSLSKNHDNYVYTFNTLQQERMDKIKSFL